MATDGFAFGDYEDSPRWERCLKAAGAAMVAAGWNTYARKFHEVQRRKARRLFWAKP